jgi:hypothetical protein
MEADLVDKGLWEYVFGDVVKPEGDTAMIKKMIAEFEMKQRQARARMIKRVMAGQLPHMRNANPKVIWAELKRVHRGGGFGSKLAMCRRFINARMGTKETMAAWISRVKGMGFEGMGFELEAIEVKVSEEDLILVLTNGLPPSFESFIITLDAARPEDITLANVVARLANEEGRQGVNVVIKEEEEQRLAESALTATKACCDHSDITCFGCGKKGHFCNECPDRKEGKGETSAVAAMAQEQMFAF